MAYTKQSWVDGDGTRPLSAARLTHIEDGIGGAHALAADATTTTKGVVQLAGDLAGTATAPTVPLSRHMVGGPRMRPTFRYGREGGAGVGTLAFNRLYVTPYYLAEAVTVDELQIDVTTAASDAGSTIRVGAWASDSTGTVPGALLVDAGTANASTAGLKSYAVSFTAQRGVLWLGMCYQGVDAVTTDPAVRRMGGLFPDMPFADASATENGGYVQEAVAGAFPATFGAVALANTFYPRVVFRVASLV